MNELALNELVFQNQDNNQVVTTSKMVAEKFEKAHKHVIAKIRFLVAEILSAKLDTEYNPQFIEKTYIDERGKIQPYFEMNRDGFTELVSNFNGVKAREWKRKYNTAFNKMEQAIKEITFRRNFIRESTKKGYRHLTDSIKSDVIPVARQQCSSVEDKYFYINAAKILNKVLGCKPYSRDDEKVFTITQLNLLDQLQDIAVERYKEAAKNLSTITEINKYVFNTLSDAANVLCASQRLAIK